MYFPRYFLKIKCLLLDDGRKLNIPCNSSQDVSLFLDLPLKEWKMFLLHLCYCCCSDCNTWWKRLFAWCSKEKLMMMVTEETDDVETVISPRFCLLWYCSVWRALYSCMFNWRPSGGAVIPRRHLKIILNNKEIGGKMCESYSRCITKVKEIV